jgi:ABC-type Fe3+-siderophore transport system permease subunit
MTKQGSTSDKASDVLLDQRALRIMLAITAVGTLAIVTFSLQATSWKSFASIIGLGTTMAGSSLLLGGLTGLLFGIPRKL